MADEWKGAPHSRQEEEVAWKPSSEDEKKRFEEEYRKDQARRAEPKKPGLLGKLGGAVTGAVKKVAEREGQLRRDRDTRKAESKSDEAYYERVAEEWKKDYPRATARTKWGTDPKTGMPIPTTVPGPPPPEAYTRQYKEATKKGADLEAKIQMEAAKSGVRVFKSVEKKVFNPRHHKNQEGKWVSGWDTRIDQVPKEPWEIEREIYLVKGQRQQIKEKTSQARVERVVAPFKGAWSAASKATDIVDRVGDSPMSRAMGYRSGGVTPMGIRGGSDLYAQRILMPPMAPRSSPGIPGMRMGGPRPMGGTGIPRMQPGSPRMSMGPRPLPPAPRPMTISGRMPSVMPTMGGMRGQAPRLNLQGGGGARKIGLFPQSGAQQQSIRKIRLF